MPTPSSSSAIIASCAPGLAACCATSDPMRSERLVNSRQRSGFCIFRCTARAHSSLLAFPGAFLISIEENDAIPRNSRGRSLYRLLPFTQRFLLIFENG